MKTGMITRRIIYTAAVILTVLLPLFMWLRDAQAAMIVGSGAVSLAFLLLIVFMDMSHQKYADALLIELSNLIDRMMNMENYQVFSDVEDTLLSRLQSQVTKLSGILKAQNEALEDEKNQIKSLITDISHQIKTPVASLKMFVDLLGDEKISEEQRAEYVQVINNSLDKLIFLTDSMIKMSRLEGGVIQLTPAKTEVREIILAAVKQAYPKAKQKNIEIIYRDDAQASEKKSTVKADLKWTAEALFNIIDNAVKYSEEGTGITISTETYPTFIRIDIEDQGPGIEEDEQSRIFARFYRGKNSEDKEGVGVGLFLSRKIIVDQGGYIKIKSNDAGSVFSVFLPCAREE